MLIQLLIVMLVVLATSLWAGWDAHRLGARRGLLPGFLDLSPAQWGFACLGLWGLAFPVYLLSRRRIRQAAAKAGPSTDGSRPRLLLSLGILALAFLLIMTLAIPILPGPLVVSGAELLRTGSPASATVCFRVAASIDESIYGDTHFYTNNARSWLGEALTKQGKYDEAERLLVAALPNIERSPQAGAFHVSRARLRIEELRTARAGR